MPQASLVMQYWKCLLSFTSQMFSRNGKTSSSETSSCCCCRFHRNECTVIKCFGCILWSGAAAFWLSHIQCSILNADVNPHREENVSVDDVTCVQVRAMYTSYGGVRRRANYYIRVRTRQVWFLGVVLVFLFFFVLFSRLNNQKTQFVLDFWSLNISYFIWYWL